jgi:hypothetical protein
MLGGSVQKGGNMWRRGLLLLLPVLVVLVVLGMMGAVQAQAPAAAYRIMLFSTDGGGVRSQGGGYSLTARAGQPAVRVLAGGGYMLLGGVSTAPAASEPPVEGRRIFLPLIRE